MSAKNHPRRKRLGRARRDGHFEARRKKQIPERGDENQPRQNQGRNRRFPRKKQIPERGDENPSHFTFFLNLTILCKKQIPERGDENVSKISAHVVPVL